MCVRSEVQYPAGQWQVPALLLWVERRPLGRVLQQEQQWEQQQQELEMQMSLNRHTGRDTGRIKLLSNLNDYSYERKLCFHGENAMLMPCYSAILKGSQTCKEEAGEESRHPCILPVYPHPWSVHRLEVQDWCACACRHQHHAKKFRIKLRLAALFMKRGRENSDAVKIKQLKLTGHDVSSRSRLGQRRGPARNSRKV